MIVYEKNMGEKTPMTYAVLFNFVDDIRTGILFNFVYCLPEFWSQYVRTHY